MRGSILGQVIDYTGNPVANISVNVRGLYYQNVFNTDDQGSFSAYDLPVGSYILMATSLDSLYVAQKTLVVHLGKQTKTTVIIRSIDKSVDIQGGRISGPDSSVNSQGRIVRQETIIEDIVFSMEYSYDEKGKLIWAIDSMNNSWKYEYTPSDKIQKVKLGDRTVFNFNYDSDGTLWKVDLPRGYKIIYLRDKNKYIKRINKYKNLILMEFSYTLDKNGHKAVVEEGADRKTRLEYIHNDQDELAEIRNLITGEKRTFAVPISEHRITQNADQKVQSGYYTYEYDNNNNLVRVRDNKNEVEVVRKFDRRNLLSSECYFFRSDPVLGIEYLYDSQDRLVVKSLSHGIRYYYLRDKDGHVVHKVMRNLLTGEEVDNVCFEPFLSDDDPDGFELVKCGNQERLFVRDAEGNRRFLVDMYGISNYKTHILQRGVQSDGESWGGVEALLSSVREMKKHPETFIDTYLGTFYDLPLENSRTLNALNGGASTQSMGNCGCYEDWYCPAEYSCCVDCGGSGGGGGNPPGGGGGGGGGGGSYDCWADISGPMQLQKGYQGTFSLMSDCGSPYGFYWYGGLGMNSGSSSYTTYWTEVGLKQVTVAFSSSVRAEIPPGSLNYEYITISKAATTEVLVKEPPITVQIDTSTATIMNISNTPAMPNVRFEATTNRDDLTNIEFHWFLTIEYSGLGGSYHQIPSYGDIRINGYNSWMPQWGGLIAGGTVTVFVTAMDLIDDTTADDQMSGYLIKGTNPIKSQVFAIASFLEAKAVFWQESTHRQFDAVRYTGIGWPLTNASNDWGISQCNAPQDERMLWSWSVNATWGVNYLNLLHNQAQNYLNFWYNFDKSQNRLWSWNPQTESPDWVWDDAFSRYNTGDTIFSINGNGGEKNCGLNQTGCNYANSVRNFMNTEPWQ